ncbi:MAG: hypothetical protein VW450_05270 [Chloroflexota bacterium]
MPGDIGAAIDEAFHYRGDVSVKTSNGRTLEGFLFNRDAHPRHGAPYLELLLREGGEEVRVPYEQVTAVHLSGKDMADGKIYAAWKRNRDVVAILNPRFKGKEA